MWDGIKLQNVKASIEDLLQILLFPLPVDETTGAILDQRRRHATDRGLTFTLIPATQTVYRCELNGSLHKYSNDGLHNANDFTINSLVGVLDQLVMTYGIDLIQSQINGIEFGLNIPLPFPASDVLTRLISYKGVPFRSQEGGIYYQAETGQYVVKVYDKGSQYRNYVPNLPTNLLRVEVKVRKVRYLTNVVPLHTLADLLRVEYYPALGSLLLETFNAILFDEPLLTVNPPNGLKSRDRDLLLSGCNWRYWQRSEGLTGNEYTRKQKRLKRDEIRFRSLLDQYRPGCNYQSEITELIRQKWDELTTVTPDLLTAITDRLTVWGGMVNDSIIIRETPENCPFFTDLSKPTLDRGTVVEGAENVRFSPGGETGNLSVFHHLYLVGLSDNLPNADNSNSSERGTPVEEVQNQPEQETRYCPVTGINITHQRANTRFLSTSSLRSLYDLDRPTFDVLAGRFLTTKQAGADLDKQCYHIAHNIRNTYTNPIRRMKKYRPKEGQTLPLFSPVDTVRPTDRLLTALEHRKGTLWEVRLP